MDLNYTRKYGQKEKIYHELLGPAQLILILGQFNKSLIHWGNEILLTLLS